MGTPSYIAIQKQPYNYTLIYEVQYRLGSVGRTSLVLKPVRTTQYTVLQKYNYDPDPCGSWGDGPYTIHRTLRSSPFEHEYPFTPTLTGLCFKVQFDDGSTREVQILDPSNHPKSAFGKKYQEMVPAYFFAFEPSQSELEQLRDVQKFMADCITVFRDGTRIQMPLTHFQLLPTHVLDGWLESCVLQRQTCPISMEPLTCERICSTPCYHVFSGTALETWVRTHQSCPTCRTFCSIDSLLSHSSVE